MIRYVGIDPSTKTGVVCLTEGLPEPYLVTFAKARDFERVVLIAERVGELCEQWQPTTVAIEGYAYGNVNTLATLVEIGTAIRMELHKRRIRWTDVPPPVLKKWTTGKGNADKAKMAQAVCEKWHFASKSDDIVDAYALARVAQRLAEVNAEFKKGLRNEDL